MDDILLEVGLVLIVAAIMGVILHALRQPLILSYILAGILIGPLGINIIPHPQFIHGISTVGVMLMLFVVGLEMNTARLKELGIVSLAAGIGQVVFTGLIGFVIVYLFGFSGVQSMYLAVALTFSSTVIAVKIMSDKKDMSSLYGQICVGIMIVQDILAIISLLFLTGFKEGTFDFDLLHFGGILLKGILLAAATILISKKALRHLYARIASSTELLILFSIAWCFTIALISIHIGFSLEIGAFIAGLGLANLPYTFEINAKTKVLRDFFITIFFVTLGAGMVFTSVGDHILPLIILSLFVLIGNPLIVLLIMNVLGYDRRTGFFTGLAGANISEFSLIVIALGNKLGHLDQSIVSITTIIAIGTMVLSSYMLTYNNFLYRILKRYLIIFDFRRERENTKEKLPLIDHIIIIGCGQVGEQVLEQIMTFKEQYIVVDHDNVIIRKLMQKNINCIFGDVEDEELLEKVSIENAEMIISTLPNAEDNYFLLQSLEHMKNGKKPIVIAVANSAREGLDLFNHGVDYVILKPYLGAQHIHHINQEIYQIALEKDPVTLSKQIHDQHSDHEIARVLHNLNKLRLKEIKEQMAKKK